MTTNSARHHFSAHTVGHRYDHRLAIYRQQQSLEAEGPRASTFALLCIATTLSIARWSTNASPNIATRCGASSPASSPTTSSGRCACRTASTSSGTRRCCASRFPTGCCRRGSCARSPRSRASTTAATAISRRARTCSSTGSGWKRRPTSWRCSPTVEMHAIQTSGNCIRNITTRPVRRRRARRDRRSARRTARSCASGRTLHPEFALPAAQVQDRGQRRARGPRRGRRCTTSACSCVHERRRRDRLPRAGRRRHGPHADDRQRDPRVPAVAGDADLRRGDPARLQPLRPPRQHLQGAHQDPGARHSAPRSSRARSKPNSQQLRRRRRRR